MKCFTNICVLPANLRPQCCKLGVDEGSGKCDQTADSPCTKYQYRRMDLASYDVRIDKDA